MPRQPNIILINCDDMGYGDPGCYGSPLNETPTLDRMAAEGMRCTDFYMASPVCSPSRGGMLTGCYPPRIGFGEFEGQWVLFPGQGVGLHPDEVTIATALRGVGYATKMVGKWHCGDQPAFLPTNHGFDSYYGLPYSNDMGRQAGDVRFPPLPLLRDDAVIQQQPDQAALTERYVEECVRFLREPRDRPFFLYLGHMYVHLPLYAQEHFLAQSRNGLFGAAMAGIDWSVAVLLHELASLGLDEQTLVIFTSDNGARGDHGGSNAPLRGGKGTTWEGGQRVPCIMRWPGVIPAGVTCRDIVASLDFLPTFAELAGTSLPADRVIDGHSLCGLLRGESPSPREEFFYYRMTELQAVRRGCWKLHVSRETPELYNLETDIGETTNIAADHPKIVADLQARLDACRRDLGDSRAGVVGTACRPVGRVENPAPLTAYDPAHPYVVAMYDSRDRG
ncbi:MAG: Arylsulfatase [bacterium ADurb.Bin429]|nr:MAG: Arylsulfatase [bacterium ADurb.Bin429]